MTENGRDVSDEPVEDCEVETPDWNRFKPEAAMACVTPNQCYTTKQVARRLGINGYKRASRPQLVLPEP